MKKLILASVLMLLYLFCAAQASTTTVTPSFNGSGGLSLDDEGNLYIGNFGNFLFASDGLLHKVWKLDKNGQMTQYSNGFLGASGNTFDKNGVLYQADIGASAIYKIVDGNRVFVNGTGISNPVGIVFDSKGNLFVCNCGNSTIRKISPSNNSTLFSSSTLLNCPNGITIDEMDNLYISNFSDGKIIKILPSGVASLLNTTPDGSTSAQSNGHLTYFQPRHSLYIASHATNQIYRLDLDHPSNLELVAGSGERGNSDDQNALRASFSRPNGVVLTTSGDSMYINSAIPVTNVPNGPLNPQVIRLITGLNSGMVSVQTLAEPQVHLSLSPDPVGNQLEIHAELAHAFGKIEIKIIDIEGILRFKSEVLALSNREWSRIIDVHDVEPGTYIIALFSNSKMLVKKKFIKQ